MSRIYIKNLPLNCSEQDVRDHFKNIGTITDVQLIKTKEGRFKRIAFVGFYNADFNQIRQQFDNTYLKSSKISVYLALSHQTAIQENRKRSVKEQQYQETKNQTKGAQKVLVEYQQKGGKELEQYIKFQQQKSWQNELLGETAVNAPQQAAAITTAPNEQKLEIDTAKIKIKNLPTTLSENELLKLMETYGPVQDVVILTHPLSGVNMQVGYVQFQTSQGAKKILKQNEILIQGKYVQVQKSYIQPERESNDQFVHPFQKKAFDKHNKLAWSFFTQNKQNIVDQLSQKTSLDSGQIQDNAVLLATGEALLNEELRKKMEEAGLDSNNNNPRSRTAILAKNLPSDVFVNQLQQLFQQFGVIIQLNAFYTGFCLVEFAQPADARRAFNKLAFRKIGKQFVPMFLEFAILKDQVVEKQVQNEEEVKKENISTKQIFVKNINFTTTYEQFEKVLKQALGSEFIKCNLPISVQQHKGYGFVVVKTDNIQNAIQSINKVIIDGSKWFAAEAAEKYNNAAQSSNQQLNTNKLIVKNLAFQAQPKEIKQLLSQFGRVVTFRAPKKLNNELRGFAFVEYASQKEAEEAMRMLGQTHFYGRHLVVEPSYDQDVDGMQDIK